MKFIITESQLDSYVIKTLNDMFPLEEINWMSPYEYDDNTGEEGEDECRAMFYLGDYEEDEYIFRWYDACYWNTDTWQGEIQYKRSPIVEVEEPYNSRLYAMFGDHWKEPFKKWFEQNIDMPIKSVQI